MLDLASTTALETRGRDGGGAGSHLLFDRLLGSFVIGLQHVLWATKVQVVDDGDLLRLQIARGGLVFGCERHVAPVQTRKLLVVVEMVLRLDSGLQPLRGVVRARPLHPHDAFDETTALRDEGLD